MFSDTTLPKLKPSSVFKQKMEGDEGFPFVWCEYHWLIINKSPWPVIGRGRQGKLN